MIGPLLLGGAAVVATFGGLWLAGVGLKAERRRRTSQFLCDFDDHDASTDIVIVGAIICALAFIGTALLGLLVPSTPAEGLADTEGGGWRLPDADGAGFAMRSCSGWAPSGPGNQSCRKDSGDTRR